MSQEYLAYLNNPPDIDISASSYFDSYYNSTLDKKWFMVIDSVATGLRKANEPGSDIKFVFESNVIASATVINADFYQSHFTDPTESNISFNQLINSGENTPVYSFEVGYDADRTAREYYGFQLQNSASSDDVTGISVNIVGSIEKPNDARVYFYALDSIGNPVADFDFKMKLVNHSDIYYATSNAEGLVEFTIDANVIVSNTEYQHNDPQPLKFELLPDVLGKPGFFPFTQAEYNDLKIALGGQRSIWFEQEIDAGTVTIDLDPVPTEIYNADDLFNMRYHYKGNFTLMNDIDLANYSLPDHHPANNWHLEGQPITWENEHFKNTDQFPPISNFYDDNYDYSAFKGSFDGKDNNILNLLIDQPDLDYMGLFRYVSDAKILNFILRSSSVTGKNRVGSIAGNTYPATTINKVGAECSLTGNGDYVGGIAGRVRYSTTTFKDCYHRGDIINTGTTTGGIAGDNYGVIENCYHTGNIESNTPVGGITTNDGVTNCYYDETLITNTSILNLIGDARTTDEMTYPYDESNTYQTWDFEHTWGIDENENDGYPTFNIVQGLLINYSANSGMDFGEFVKNHYMFLNGESVLGSEIGELKRLFPIVRTDFATRDNFTLLVAGTLLDPAQYNDELWNGKISGFFQWVPERFEFDDFSLNKTGLTELPYKKYSLVAVNVVEDIQIEDTEIVVENIPSDFQIASENGYGYLVITDGTNSEAIGYGLTETRDVDGELKNIIGDIDRGVFTSNVKSFNAVDTVVYKTYLETSLTWDDEISPVARMTKYKYRAGIEVDTELSTTGENKTFTFYGGTMIADVDDSDSDIGDFSGMDRSELFLDARDLEFEDQLFDRAKLKFEEMEFESWNLEEFKDWTWDEFQNPESLEFERMTLAELIKIADGITDYEERDLVNNYSREEIEQIIQDKLNVVTVDDIESWAFDVSKLVARLLTGESSGAYDDWTEREVKDFLITMLTNEFSFGDFESKFPFEKWETIMKARIEININNNASIEVEYNQYGPYNYMIDFQLGDIIVVEYPDVFRAMIRIIEVKEEYTPEGKKYTLTLGKEFENIISKIKADNDDVSRRL